MLQNSNLNIQGRKPVNFSQSVNLKFPINLKHLDKSKTGKDFAKKSGSECCTNSPEEHSVH